MSDSSPVDPRVRRTRRLLQEAVFALATEREFNAITVQEITRRAEVNRATFYLHYRDKEDLIAQALDALFDEVTAEDRAFLDAHGQLSPETVPPPVADLFRHVAERPELYRRLLAESGSSAFASRLRAFHEREFIAMWHKMELTAAPGSPPPELRARFAATATQGVIGWWLEHNDTEPFEMMATWLWELVRPLWFGELVASGEAVSQ
jgi:AcrR family transcriptional regulator